MARIPSTLLGGRLRTSTLLLSLTFLAVLALYLVVRPPPTPSYPPGAVPVVPTQTTTSTPRPTRTTSSPPSTPTSTSRTVEPTPTSEQSQPTSPATTSSVGAPPTPNVAPTNTVAPGAPANPSTAGQP